MDHFETSMSQNDNLSTLSAEAESFVPGKYKIGGAGNNNCDIPAPPLNQLPRYMTNCYPFVQTECGPGVRSSIPPHGPGRPPGPNFNNHRMHSPHGGSFSNHGNNSMRSAGGSRSSRSQQGHISQLPIPPQNSGYSPGPPGNFMPFPNYPGMPPSAPVWPGQPVAGMPYSGQEWYNPAMFSPGNCDPGDWNGPERVKSSDRKKKKKATTENSNMVSIGIQNENGIQPSGSGSKKKPKIRTIICMDAAIQTDFSDEIANLRLTEKPSSLYSKEKSRSWLQHYSQDCSSTDSEEKDSDSGYSSPMHRRNQASNGTHPVIGMPYMQNGMNPALMPKTGPSGFIPHPGYHQNTTGQQHFPYPSGIPNHRLMPPRAMYGGPFLPPFTSQPFTSQPIPGPNVHNSASLPVGFPVPHTPAVNSSNGLLPSKTMSANSTTRVEHEDEEASGKKTKKRRNRRKKKRNCGEDIGALSDDPLDIRRAHSSSNVSRTSTIENEIALHFDDEEEFPNLLSAAGGLPGGGSVQPCVTYSDVLKSQVSTLSQDSSVSGSDRFRHPSGPQSGNNSSSEVSKISSQAKESKNARKRRKRRELANQAAEEELAEISLEQQVLKEMSAKHNHNPPKKEESNTKSSKEPTPKPSQPQVSSGKKSKQPMTLDLADMISALDKQAQEQEQAKQREASLAAAARKKETSRVANPLDSSAPAKRGKEREVPKAKKPSPLKKVILKEREEKKRIRQLDESNPLSPGEAETDDDDDDDDDNDDDDDDDDVGSSVTPENSQMTSIAGMPMDSDLSQDAVSSKASSMDFGTPASADMSPISQTSPISMSPLSGSPLSSGVNSPIAGNNSMGSVSSSVLLKIHSRRFREYCNQVLDKDIDQHCTLLLQELVRFQDRLFHKDPSKAKQKRRIVLGLREVTKHLKLRKIKCVIISPNLERIQSKGGLDDALNNIISLCQEQYIPFVFALGRRALGRACAKLVPVSVVGIFNYEGTEEHFKKLIDLTQQAQSAYQDMVGVLEDDMEASSTKNMGTPAGVGGFAQLFPHLGHSRTPSACSAISFTSSILSEPISENYPHSEPETDSRGYEIVKDDAEKKKIMESMTADKSQDRNNDADIERSESPNSGSSQGKIVIVEALDEIDEGHEADTEDDPHYSHRHHKELLKLPEADANSAEVEEAETDTVQELPHIDSIHSSVVDLSAEILSQHSSKTIDLNTEVMSTHSSRTIEGAATAGAITPDLSLRGVGSSPDLREASCSSGQMPSSAQRIRPVDKDRIESWVAETQKQIEKLSVAGHLDIELDEDKKASQMGCSQSDDNLDSNSCDFDEKSDVDSDGDSAGSCVELANSETSASSVVVNDLPNGPILPT